MVDDGYLIGYEDGSGNFVEVGRLNNTAEDTTKPVQIKHANSGESIELDSNGLSTNSVSTDETTINNLGGKGNKNSTQSIPSSTVTRVELDNVEFEDDSANIVEVDTSNNQLMVKKSGVKYDIKACFSFIDNLADGDRILAVLDVNGTTICQFNNIIGGAQNPSLSLTDVKELSSTDTITLSVFHDSGSSKDLRSGEVNSLAATIEG